MEMAGSPAVHETCPESSSAKMASQWETSIATGYDLMACLYGRCHGSSGLLPMRPLQGNCLK